MYHIPHNPELKFRSTLTQMNLRRINGIVLHHLKWKKVSPKALHADHLKRRTDDVPWLGAGYNEYIRRDGESVILRGTNVGAHCSGHNSTKYGIGLEGDFTKQQPTYLQLLTLIQRLEHLQGVVFEKPLAIYNHRDLADTTCPIIDLTRPQELLDNKYKTILLYLYQRNVLKNVPLWKQNAKVLPNLYYLMYNMYVALAGDSI